MLGSKKKYVEAGAANWGEDAEEEQGGLVAGRRVTINYVISS